MNNIDRLVRPPNFDPVLAPTCNVRLCGAGNGALAIEQRQCTYMEQTNPMTNDAGDICVFPADLASDPDKHGWMRALCPFGEDVYTFRILQTDETTM
jgi:hypothetical protein